MSKIQPRGRRKLGVVAAVAAVLALTLLLSAVASAQTLDSPWTGSGSGTVSVVSDGSTSAAELQWSQTGFSGSWKFETTAASAQARTVNWTYSGLYSWFEVQAGLQAFVTHGTTTSVVTLVNAGPEDCCTTPSNGFTYSGAYTFHVQPGDTYGFLATGSNFDSSEILQGTLTVNEAPFSVGVDVKPGSDTNPINVKSKGVTPIAILGSADFNVSWIDVNSLEFGPNHASPVDKNGGNIEDVNGDGYPDLVLHFRTQDTGISAGDTQACVSGNTVQGIPLSGCDSIVTVGK